MISPAQEVLRLLAAALLGGLIGLERERLDRGAGLRTHTLVATASALVMIVSAYGFTDVVTANRTIVLDPSRIAAQVVSGIGFLGAGTIVFRRNAVRGLTTAAGVWAVAAIGLACGAGLFAAAGACTAILLLVLIGLKPIERRFFEHKQVHQVTVLLRRQPGQITSMERVTRDLGIDLRRVALEPGDRDGESRVRLHLRGGPRGAVTSLAERLQAINGVTAITFGADQIIQPNGNSDSTEEEED